MAVTSCKLDRSGRASFDRRIRGSYESVYIVEADAIHGAKQLANLALSSSPHPLPALGEDYDLRGVYPTVEGQQEYDPHSYALDYGIDIDEATRKKAMITVRYTPLEPGESQDRRTIAIPTNRGAKYHWEQETYQKIIDRDRNLKPLVNGAGKSFDRPVAIEAVRPLFLANFNVANQATAISLTRTYYGAVNATTWTAFSADPRTVVCRYTRSGETVTENGSSYVPFTMAFAFAEAGETWDERVLNEGYGHYQELSSQSYGYAFASADFTTATDPIPLNGGVVVKDSTDPGPLSEPSSVPQPSPAISGSLGDQISLVYSGSAWSVGEPLPNTGFSSGPIYKKAKALDENGAETTDDVSEPILLYGSGVRLPEGMIGNFITARIRREVDFNNLSSYLTATPAS